jgi:hypothetical protein
VIDECFAEQGPYEAEVVTQGKIFLSISYWRGLLDAWQADNVVTPASHGVSSTVPVSKLGKVLVAGFGIVLKDSNPDCGIRDFNTCDIER